MPRLPAFVWITCTCIASDLSILSPGPLESNEGLAGSRAVNPNLGFNSLRNCSAIKRFTKAVGDQGSPILYKSFIIVCYCIIFRHQYQPLWEEKLGLSLLLFSWISSHFTIDRSVSQQQSLSDLPIVSAISLLAKRAARPATWAPKECPTTLVVTGFRSMLVSRKSIMLVTCFATSGTLLTTFQYQRFLAASRQSIKITL